ncbi:PREDICTED: uncharacterized protein LOC109180758 [Ipomoea nil]|uniref:uncharacterized protein LOC109180758 n=1 Tax=Ipomoea nil TaxID=35883 RepID=UPI000901B2D2|nr:PREDICTED: uncharacterized protein LOC109180758 [Ipomoea nil]
MIPSCFSNPTSASSSPSSSSVSQNLVTCIYQTRIFGSPIHLTLTWSKILFSHSLTIHAADDMFSITLPLQAPTFSLFQSRSGSKTIQKKVKVYWDFTRAKYAENSAEPESGFYVAIICHSKLEFFLGDRLRELVQRAGPGLARCIAAEQAGPGLARCIAVERAGLGVARGAGLEPTLLSRREHVFGRRMSYNTRAVLLGTKHEFGIECGGGVLKVKVDGEVRLVVKRLAWKFRGNERILVGEMEVEFYWDVFNWVSKCDNNNNNNKFGKGHGVFVFQIGDVGVWPEMEGVEKKLVRKSLSLTTGTVVPPSSPLSLSPSSLSPSCSSVLQWAEESSDCGRSPCSSSRYSSGGFTLLLYAWRKA